MLNKYFKSKKAFTLVEFIIVMAIIGILVLLASPKFLDYINKAKLTQIKNDVKVVENWNKAYYADNLKLPTDKEVSYQSILVHINKLKNYNNESTNIAKNNFIKTIYANDGIEQDFKTQLYFYDERGLITNSNFIKGDKFYLLDKEEVVKNTNTKLKGFFITNNKGDVFYTDDKNYINNKENIDLGLCRYEDLLQYKGKDYKIDDRGYITYFNKDNYVKQENGIFEVPGVINGTIVKGIADGTSNIEGSTMTFNGVFSGLDIKELKLPCTLEYIGSFAFAQNRIIKLNTNDTPNLKEIEEGAFQDNPIKELIISENINYIGKNNLGNNTKLIINRFDSEAKFDNQKSNKDILIINSSLKPYIFDIVFKPNYQLNYTKNGINLSNYTGHKKEIFIPKYINNKKVTHISKDTFKGKGIEIVHFPDSVEYIGDYAFAFNLLREVKLPKNIKYIGNYAFGYNTKWYNYKEPTIKQSIIIEDVVKYNNGIDKETGNINKKLNIEENITFEEGIFKIYDKDSNIIILNDEFINSEKKEEKNNEDENNQNNQIEFTKYKVKQFDSGSRYSAAITEDGKLYTWGIGGNKIGQGDKTLNNINKDKDSIQTIPMEIKDLKNVKQVALSNNHSAAITEDGDLYTWGNNNHGQLGHGNTKSISIPKKVNYFSDNNLKVQQVELGYTTWGEYFSAAITEDGDLYTWGYANNQLGHHDKKFNSSINIKGTEFSIQTIPMKVENLNNIKQFVFGESHALALTKSGYVYTWGNGKYGQLGHSNTRSLLKPKKVEILSNIIQIQAGDSSSAALTENGTVYTWGENLYGELGHKNKKQYNTPEQIKDLFNIKQISLGFNYSAALNLNGDLYTWGNRGLNLGHNNNNSNLNQPKKVDYFTTNNIKIKNISIKNVSAIITEDGDLYTWGYGSFGQLGHNNTDDLPLPTKVKFFNNN